MINRIEDIEYWIKYLSPAEIAFILIFIESNSSFGRNMKEEKKTLIYDSAIPNFDLYYKESDEKEFNFSIGLSDLLYTTKSGLKFYFPHVSVYGEIGVTEGTYNRTSDDTPYIIHNLKIDEIDVVMDYENDMEKIEEKDCKSGFVFNNLLAMLCKIIESKTGNILEDYELEKIISIYDVKKQNFPSELTLRIEKVYRENIDKIRLKKAKKTFGL